MKISISKRIVISLIMLSAVACKAPSVVQVTPKTQLPSSYVKEVADSTGMELNWRTFFNDRELTGLIDSAMKNNLEVLQTMQEIEIASNEVRAWNSKLFPVVNAGAGIGLDKSARYTSEGAGNASTEMTPGKKVPEPLVDMMVGFQASWEADIWGKLHNYKRAAAARYMESIEGRNLLVTQLVSEIAATYYERLALYNQLQVIREAITLQQNQLEVVKVQKDAARATELAVKQFEAQVYNSQAQEYYVLQQIRETENKLSYLTGQYPKEVSPSSLKIAEMNPAVIKAGVPSDLLKNRPDIRAAEYELFATNCDVKAARAEFYPSFEINGAAGFRAFKSSYLFTAPESVAYSIAGDLMAPLINRNAIRAEFNKAKTSQLKAMYAYQERVLNAYVEVSNQLSNIRNLSAICDLKVKQVEAMKRSIEVANDLYTSAHADYLEVLTAQRDALETNMELIEAKKMQFVSVVNMYRALGGGWK